uniref:CxC3 like cysteine cluster domain-containing protein n=2 Tax=Clytia hemisphaerica TaxID=252671 RepID=A0A7M5XND4_9CNID
MAENNDGEQQCSSQPSQSKRPRKTSLGLMKQIVAVNKSLKAKAKPKKKSEICFVELKRSAETGQRIYKLKRPKHNNGMKRRISNTVITADEQVLDIDAKNSNWQIAENVDTIDNEELNDINPQSDTKMNSWLETLLNFVKTKKKKKSWFERSRSCQEDWDLLRKNIWRTMQAREVLDEHCNVCCDRLGDLYCMDCHKSFCHVCDDVFHLANPFHDRLSSGRYLDVLECLDEKKEIIPTVRYPPLKCVCSVCGSKEVTKIATDEYCIVVTLKGRFDVNKYHLRCNECTSLTDPFTTSVLLSSGFWPGNPKSLNYLFKEEVFQLWDKFRKFMPGSSERAFLKSLNSISDDFCRKATINPTNFAMAFRDGDGVPRMVFVVGSKRPYSIQRLDGMSSMSSSPP